MCRKTSILKSMIAVALVGTTLWGCKKPEVDSDTQSAKDNAIAEFVCEDALNIVDNDAKSTAGINKMAPAPNNTSSFSCANTTIDTANRTITWDFGTSGCTSNDGRLRRGKIKAQFSDYYSTQSCVTTITFIDYYINTNRLDGTIKVTTGNNVLTVEIIDGVVTTSSGKTVKWSATVTRALYAENTATPTDNVYSITGGGTGVNINGVSYTTKITSPLLIDLGCDYRLTQGTVEITPADKPTRTLDFGSGNCDTEATVTINGNVWKFNLE